MRRLFLAALLMGCLLASADTALIPDMKFRRLDTRDGMSSSQVNCVFKDSRGFVWIGTPYGLNRYDGYRFRTFYSNIRDTTSMRDNYTDQVFEAYDGKLWLKQGMTYCVYDPVTERFERNPMRILSKFGFDGGLERLFIDSKKNFWVKLYEQGLFFYNPKTKHLHHFPLGYDKNEFNPTYGISSADELGDKLVLTTNCGELVCLDGEKGTIDWENKWMRENGGVENQDYKLTIDKDGNYWVASLEYTFVYIKKENRWYKSIPEYLKAHGITDVPDDLYVWAVMTDQKGWLWFVADHEGLFVADLKNKQIKQFKSNKYDETTISDNTPRSIYQDPEGLIWIGTYKNGVNQYVESLSSFQNLELGDINTVCEDKHGNYWIGTNDDGILVYDPKTGEVKSHYTAENSGLTGNIVVGSYPASDGSIWFGSYNGGLTHCIPSAADPTKATVVNYRATGRPGELANNSVWALTEDKWQRIWFTTLGSGLQMYDPKTGKFQTWDTHNTNLPSDYMSSIGWTKKGWLLAGTSYYYAIVNPVSMKLMPQVFPEDPSITVNIATTAYVLEDSRGLFWQGSTSGLAVYDPNTKFVTLLDMTKGLYGSSINSIAEDKRHTIWAVTDHGVSNIVPQKLEDGTWQFNIRSFNSRDGLQKATYNQRSTWVTRSGLLLVGGQGGIDVIDPSKLVDSKSKEKPIFSGLQLFDQTVVVGEKVNGRVILSEALDVCRELDLYFNDQFTVQLATDGGLVSNHKRFVYKLLGFNDDVWVKTSEQNPNITYNQLRAGSYTLCVRILNEDGSIGDEESRLEIYIHPPLWRTRWAVLLYMIVIALAALLWRYRFMKKQKELAELERMRRELEKRQWMSEMRSQMQAEQAAMRKAAGEEVEPEPITVGEAHEVRLVSDDLVPFMKEQCGKFKAPDHKRVKFSFFPLANSLQVRFDKNQLGSAVQILLDNAVKFSPSDCRVKVFVEPGEHTAIIRVADSGVGIPEEALKYVFAPVVGDDDVVGLNTVKDIVTAHGGTVEATENPSGGSVFTITLPLDEVVVEEAVLMEDEEETD